MRFILIGIWVIIINPLLFTNRVLCQPGTLDSAFGSNGITETKWDWISEITALAIQPDGKILAGGYIKSSSSQFDFWLNLARYYPDGSVDHTFGDNGITQYPPISASGLVTKSIRIQTDGKIIQAGESLLYLHLVRYNSNGFVDTSFGNSGAISYSNIHSIQSMVLDENEKIIILAGESALWRFNPDGTVDSSFGIGGSTPAIDNSSSYDLAIQNDGKIIAVGSVSGGIMVLRWNSDGSLDQNFGYNGISIVPVDIIPFSLALQNDGKIVVSGGGYGTSFSYVARFKNDGNLDSLFATNGIVSTEFNSMESAYYGVAIQSNGKIVTAGYSKSGPEISSDITVACYNLEGTLDSSFGISGKVINDVHGSIDRANDVVIQPDGKILVGGASTDTLHVEYQYCMIRYLSDLNVGEISFSQKNIVMAVFPNPVHEIEILKYQLKEPQAISISLLDANGKVIKSFAENEFKTSGQHSEILSLPELSSGSYLLIISNSLGENFAVKVVK